MKYYQIKALAEDIKSEYSSGINPKNLFEFNKKVHKEIKKYMSAQLNYMELLKHVSKFSNKYGTETHINCKNKYLGSSLDNYKSNIEREIRNKYFLPKWVTSSTVLTKIILKEAYGIKNIRELKKSVLDELWEEDKAQ